MSRRLKGGLCVNSPKNEVLVVSLHSLSILVTLFMDHPVWQAVQGERVLSGECKTRKSRTVRFLKLMFTGKTTSFLWQSSNQTSLLQILILVSTATFFMQKVHFECFSTNNLVLNLNLRVVEDSRRVLVLKALRVVASSSEWECECECDWASSSFPSFSNLFWSSCLCRSMSSIEWLWTPLKFSCSVAISNSELPGSLLSTSSSWLSPGAWEWSSFS